MTAGSRTRRIATAVATAAVLMVLLAIAGTAQAAGATKSTTTGPTWVATPGPKESPPRLRPEGVKRIARESPKLRAWRENHPTASITATSDRKNHTWTVAYLDRRYQAHAQVIVSDDTGHILEVRTGPQVAWQMARGYKGAFGRSLTKRIIWIPLFILFLVPLIDWRRPVSLHTLDLLMLCSFAVSLHWFNRGEIFTSVPLSYPPLVYLFIRLIGVGFRGRRVVPSPEAAAPRSAGPRVRSVFPTWLLVAVLLFTLGLRFGLNAFDSNVIDVGYAGVIGADRIAHGETPYGTFPSDCGQCDTYGPMNYLAYVPFEAAAPWVGRWNDLPAAHAAASAFDLAAILALFLLGWRLGGNRMAVAFALAWAAYPFTTYALESNSNDALPAALLAWGLVLAHRPVGRGLALGLAALAKFTPAILIPLWFRHPFPRAGTRPRRLRYLAGLAAAVVVAGWPIILDGTSGVRRFWSRTLGFQLDRESPFSVWGQHPGLHLLHTAVKVAVVALAVLVMVRPKRIDLRQFAALSGAILIGVQLTMPHWFYLYIPWFIPFVIVALIPHWPARVVAAADPPPPAVADPPPAGTPA